MPPEPAIDRRIFVVGVPRSGTTLVQSLLAAHSAVTSFTESHFFSRHFRLLPLLELPILMRSPVPRLREFLAENDEPSPDAAVWFDRHVRTRPLLPFQTRRVARQLLRILDELTERRGRSSWVEKTPRHLRYIRFLDDISTGAPRTSFVHVIRDGLEVVASLHEASKSWERSYDVDTCVRRWNRDVHFSLERVEKPDDHFVFYEELTSAPEAALRQLLAALGLPWEPEILARYESASDRVITEQEVWKAGLHGGIRPSGTSERTLTPEQRERVSRSLRRALYDQLLERARRRSIPDASTGLR